MVINLPPNSESHIDSLCPMAGQMVFIEVDPDAEARRASRYIFRALVDAKWDVQEPLKLVDGLADGVSVQPWVPPAPKGGEISNMSPYDHASELAGKLVTFLHSYNWQANEEWPRNAHGDVVHEEKVLPAEAIRKQIGLYPPTVYVSPPGQKEFTSAMEEQKRMREKVEAESKRKLEEERATLPPEFRQELQRAEVEW